MSPDRYQGTHAVVTGGAGFIGSHLTEALLEAGAVVTVVDDLSFGSPDNVDPRARFIQADAGSTAAMLEAVKGAHYVFHLAAAATTKESAMGWNDPQFDMRANVGGTLGVLEAVRQVAPTAKVVLASSAAVYGVIEYTPIDEQHPTRPVSPYGVSKLAAEEYCGAYGRELGIHASAMRVFNTFGPRQPRYVMHDLIMKLKANPNQLMIIGDGTQVRDYTYVADTVQAFLLVGQAEPGVYNAASGIGTTIREIAEAIVDEIAPGATIRSEGPTWTGDIPTLVGSAQRLEELGYKPSVTLVDGIRSLVESYDDSV